MWKLDMVNCSSLQHDVTNGSHLLEPGLIVECQLMLQAELDRANAYVVQTLIPVIVILAILLVVGAVGNTLVCYIFCLRLKSSTQHFFIVCLAGFDLFSCTFAIPGEMIDLVFFYNYPSTMLCKILRLNSTFPIIGATATLIFIAVDRFRRICKYNEPQMTLRHAKLLLIPIFGSATIISLPAVLLYGIRHIDVVGIPGVRGKDCSTKDRYSNTLVPSMYNVALFCFFLICTSVLVTLYSLVLRKLGRHSKSLFEHKSKVPNSNLNRPRKCSVTCATLSEHAGSTSKENDSNIEDAEVADEASQNTTAMNVDTLEPEISGDPGVYEESISSEVRTSHTEKKSKTAKRTSLNRKHHSQEDTPSEHTGQSTEGQENILGRRGWIAGRFTRLEKSKITNPSKSLRIKTTKIAFIVTMVFITSFLPHLCVQVATYIGDLQSTEGACLVLSNLLGRSYFINSVANPIIYGVLNKDFRKEVKELIRLKSWICCKKN